MIEKIKEIKNFAIFKDFKWENLEKFKKYNLFYGYNGSGKTTLSRLFSSLEKKEIYKDYQNKDLKFTINENINEKNFEKHELDIKVFNQDFIKDNVFFDDIKENNKNFNPILLIGEEDIKTKKELNSKNEKKGELEKELNIADNDLNNKRKNYRKNLETLAKDIKDNAYIENYDRRNLTKDLENFKEKLLKTNEMLKHKRLINNEKKEKITTISFDIKEEDLKEIINRINEILAKSPISQTIDRLKENPSLNNWVQEGFEKHIKDENCPFCEAKLDDNFTKNLEKHFSEDLKNLKEEIKKEKENLNKFIKNLELPSKNDFYEQFKDDFNNNSFKISEQEFNDFIEEIKIKLEEKEKDIFKSFDEIKYEENKFKDLKNSTYYINKLIEKHNQITDDHDQKVKEAKEELKIHYISQKIKNIKTKEADIKNIEKNLENMKKNLNDLNTEIKELVGKVSDIRSAVEKINEILKNFFGDDFIKIELKDKNYIIKREGYKAKNLSEGEKTVIAISYFIIKIKEKKENLKNTIIYIDDPISSLDTNFIYTVYALINEYFKDDKTKQLFISTHNFEFFELIRSSLYKNKDCSLYMIEKEDKEAKIKECDNVLKNFNSEYEYLFYKVYNFNKNLNNTFENKYIIGNIMRRVLEGFLKFKVPHKSNLKQKLEVLSKNEDELYKIVNDNSHTPKCIEHKDLNYMQEIAKQLINFIKTHDKVHFDNLEKAFNPKHHDSKKSNFPPPS